MAKDDDYKKLDDDEYLGDVMAQSMTIGARDTFRRRDSTLGYDPKVRPFSH